MFHDPYSNEQIKAYRRDPTCRWSPIVEDEQNEPWWYGYAIGIAAGCVFAFMAWWAI